MWDLAPSQVLVEEAGGRFAVVRDFPILSAVFGRPALVDHLVALSQGDGTPRSGATTIA